MTAVIEMFRLFVLCEVFTVIKTALKWTFFKWGFVCCNWALLFDAPHPHRLNHVRWPQDCGAAHWAPPAHQTDTGQYWSASFVIDQVKLWSHPNYLHSARFRRRGHAVNTTCSTSRKRTRGCRLRTRVSVSSFEHMCWICRVVLNVDVCLLQLLRTTAPSWGGSTPRPRQTLRRSAGERPLSMTFNP